MKKATGVRCAGIVAGVMAAAAIGCASDWTSVAEDVPYAGTDAYGDTGAVALLTGIQAPSSLQVDRGTVFWVTQDGLWSMPVAGAQPTRISESVNSHTFAVDQDFVYWEDDTDALLRAPRSGGASVRIVSDIGSLQDLALWADTVYWSSGPRVMLVSKFATDGQPQEVSTDLPDWISEGMVVDEHFVFAGVGGAVYRADRAGTGDWAVVVPNAGLTSNDLFSDGTDLFLSSGGVGLVRRASKDGAGLRVFEDQSYTIDMAFDAGWGYWTGSYPCASRMSLQTGDTQFLRIDNLYCHEVAVDDAWIYWTAQAQSGDVQGIYRAPLTNFK